MVAISATCFTVIGRLASRLRMRILLNGSPVRSTTARRQPSLLSRTSADRVRHTSSARGLDMGGPHSLLIDQRCQPLGGPVGTARCRRDGQYGDDEPSAMLMNHSGRAAEVKSAPSPARAGPATEPHSATPILTPTCREVEVTADAAPARPWASR